MDIDKKYDNYDFPVTAAEPQDGHAGHLTEQQIAQVHQLRMMLEAEGYTARLDTLTLVRMPETLVLLLQCSLLSKDSTFRGKMDACQTICTKPSTC